MNRTGGGYLKSHGLGNGASGLPSVQPMKPMGPLPTAPEQTQGGPAPMGQPPMPPQGAMPPQEAPQGMPPQGMPDQGMPPPQGEPEQGGDPGVNHVANNALRLFHDPDSGLVEMVAQSKEGATEALVTVYDQLRQAYDAQGEQMDPEMSAEATEELMKDVKVIGQAEGIIQSQDDVDDIFSQGLSRIAQMYPDVADDLQAMMAEMSPEDMAQGEAIASRAGGGMGQPMPQETPPSPQGGYLGA